MYKAFRSSQVRQTQTAEQSSRVNVDSKPCDVSSSSPSPSPGYLERLESGPRCFLAGGKSGLSGVSSPSPAEGGVLTELSGSRTPP